LTFDKISQILLPQNRKGGKGEEGGKEEEMEGGRD
jgi:hypothetical protein